MPSQRQNKTPRKSTAKRKKDSRGAKRTLTKSLIKTIIGFINEGCGTEQAFILAGVAKSTGFNWLTQARDAREQIHHSTDEEEIKDFVENNRLFLELLEGVEKGKARVAVDRDKIIAKWGKIKDWRAAAHLNKIHSPGIYGDQAVIDRGVEEKLQTILSNVFFLVSPSAYQELKNAIAQVTEQSYNLSNMDELKAIQVLMESEWLDREDAEAIGTEYLKMREAVKEFLNKKLTSLD